MTLHFFLIMRKTLFIQYFYIWLTITNFYNI